MLTVKWKNKCFYFLLNVKLSLDFHESFAECE